MDLRFANSLRVLLLPVAIALWLGSGGSLHAVNLSPFYTFPTTADFTQGGVAQTPDGALYTFVTDPAAVLLRFAPDGSLTQTPITGYADEALSGPLLLASDGNFYGVVLGGSPPSSPLGSLFRLTPDGVLTLLHVFTGGDDGTYPQPGLVQGADGALYGATNYVPNESGVPTGEAGTIFRCTLDGTLTTLHHFPGGVNSPIPAGTLTVGHDGNLYGLASSVLFSITPAGDYTVLHDFTTEGYSERPNSGFVQDPAGFFYGTTQTGGSEDPSYPFASGTVFRFTPDGQVTILYRFDGQEGALPTGPLAVGPDGNFYGILSEGGDGVGIDFEEGGALFRVTPAGAVTVIYHDHTDTDLHYAPVGLTTAADGSLYAYTPDGLLRVLLVSAGSLGLTNDTYSVEASDGVAYIGFYRTDDTRGEVSVDYATADDTALAGVDYTASSGTVHWADGDSGIKIVRVALPDVPATQFSTSKQFSVQLGQPTGGAALLPSSKGTVVISDSGDGPPGAGVSSLFTFSGGVDGAEPLTLYPATDGSLVGASVGSGIHNDRSTIFRFDADGSLRLLADAAFLESNALTQGRDGNFYGTRFLPNDPDPTLCRLSPDGTLTTVADLGPSASEEEDYPYRTLIQARDGTFYGAVDEGTYDTKHHIRIFHVAADGTQTTLHTLSGTEPVYLLEGVDGLLYGLRYTDGKYAGGFVFSVSPTGDYRVVHDFTNDITGPGHPATPLYQASNGRFYGLSLPADGSNLAAFYQLKPNGKIKVLHRFIRREGSPAAQFVAGDDGNFYGTVSGVGYGGTVLYRLTPTGELTQLFYTGDNNRDLQLLAFRSDGTAFLTEANDENLGLYTIDTTSKALPTVAIEPTDDIPSVVAGGKALIVITRTGNTDAPLTLSYTLGGTAQSGVDYQPLSGTVTIPAGSVDARIAVKSSLQSYYIPTTQTYTLDLKLQPAADGSYELAPGGKTVEFEISGVAH